MTKCTVEAESPTLSIISAKAEVPSGNNLSILSHVLIETNPAEHTCREVGVPNEALPLDVRESKARGGGLKDPVE